MSTEKPMLSVVMVVGDLRDRAAAALDSIVRQNIIDRIEVVIVDCAVPGAQSLPGIGHPSVLVLPVSADATFGEARAEGLRQSRAPIVAFLEEHCTVLPGWAEALVEAHEGPWAGVAGEIHSANPGVGFSDALFLLGYSAWLPPASRGEADSLPSHNISYKREILRGYYDGLPDLLIAEPILLWKLNEDGHKLFLEPAARFTHLNDTSLASVLAFSAWSRFFGHTRAREFNWPTRKRAIYFVLSPLVPWWRAVKLLIDVARNKSERLGTLIINLPRVIIALYATAIGQALGVMFGKGNSAARFSYSELNEPRRM